MPLQHSAANRSKQHKCSRRQNYSFMRLKCILSFHKRRVIRHRHRRKCALQFRAATTLHCSQPRLCVLLVHSLLFYVMGWSSIGLNFYGAPLLEWTPMNMLLAILCIYSLVVNYQFGHPTYWRRSRSLDKLSTLVSGELSLANVGSPGRPKLKNMSTILHNIDQDTLIYIWSYFTPHDLTITSQLSKSHNQLLLHRSLWMQHAARLPKLVADPSPVLRCGKDDMRGRYFETLSLVIQEMLRGTDKLVILLQGDLYDLTHFVHEHPGGDAILVEFQGKDATVMFERVTHSSIALEIRQNFLLFSPGQFKGALGWPKFCAVRPR